MVLEVRELTKTFGPVKAVNGISFKLTQGEVLGLLGRNGAGKSTTIKMMLDLIEKDGGSITWNGHPLKDAAIKIGYLPEERGLYAKTKIIDQLVYFGRLEGMDKRSIKTAIDYWFERFDMNDYRKMTAGELSKGNQQKIQLIATLLHNPDLIILDEPFSGLDPVNATVLSTVIEELISQGKTIILSSHQMEQIEHFCKNVCLMKQGKFVVSGKLQQIKDDYGYKNFSITIREDIRHLMDLFPLKLEQNEDTFSTKVKNENDALEVLQILRDNGIVAHNFMMIEPTLHQIFVERVK